MMGLVFKRYPDVPTWEKIVIPIMSVIAVVDVVIWYVRSDF